MRLVIEQVQENVGDPLLIRLAAGCTVGMDPVERRVVITGDERDKTIIFGDPRPRQFTTLLIYDGV
jgi:hypothetical protein